MDAFELDLRVAGGRGPRAARATGVTPRRRDESRRRRQNELLEHLGGGRAKQAWKRPKTRLVAQLIATVEALGRHSTVARRTLFALPPSYGNVLGDEYPKYDEEKCALLLHVLPLINGNDRLDAVMLTECLHLLGSLVLTGNGFMLNALYKILFEKVREAQKPEAADET